MYCSQNALKISHSFPLWPVRYPEAWDCFHGEFKRRKRFHLPLEDPYTYYWDGKLLEFNLQHKSAVEGTTDLWGGTWPSLKLKKSVKSIGFIVILPSLSSFSKSALVPTYRGSKIWHRGIMKINFIIRKKLWENFKRINYKYVIIF